MTKMVKPWWKHKKIYKNFFLSFLNKKRTFTFALNWQNANFT